jgi:hypothetical protein
MRSRLRHAINPFSFTNQTAGDDFFWSDPNITTMKKPIDAKLHGMLDYGFAAINLVGPALLKLPKQTKNIYAGIAGTVVSVNAVTDTPVGLKPVMSFKNHQKADLSLLGTLALLTVSKPIREHRPSLYFHLGMLAAAITQYALTDFNRETAIMDELALQPS